MAATPVSKTFDLSASERELVVRALTTLAGVTKRAINAELNGSVKEIRQGELNAVEALALRFR